MKMSLNILFVAAFLLSATSCEKEGLNYSTGDLRINLETVDALLHDFPLFLGISKKIRHSLLFGLKTLQEIIFQQFLLQAKLQQKDGSQTKVTEEKNLYLTGVISEDWYMMMVFFYQQKKNPYLTE